MRYTHAFALKLVFILSLFPSNLVFADELNCRDGFVEENDSCAPLICNSGSVISDQFSPDTCMTQSQWTAALAKVKNERPGRGTTYTCRNGSVVSSADECPKVTPSGDRSVQTSGQGTGSQGDTKPQEKKGEKTPDTKSAWTDADKEALEKKVKECKEVSNKTVKCCGSPMTCMTDMSTGDAQAVSMLGQMAVGQATTSMLETCQAMKTGALTGAGLNGAFATMCTNQQSDCKSSCDYDEISKRLSSCKDAKTCGAYDDLTAAKSSMNSYYRRCEAQTAQSTTMMTQAAASMTAVKMAQLCEEQMKLQSTGFPQLDQQQVFNGNCNDPANMSNPICQSCQRPGAENDPKCKGLTSGTNPIGGQPNFGNPNTGNNLVDLGDGPGSQKPALAPTAAQDQRANVENQKGGGVPQGMAGGQGMGGPNGAPNAPGSGYNTDIFKGERSGGYSTASVGTNGTGGFSGYGSQGGTDKNGFNLRQFLPGGAKDPNRKIAGVGVPIPVELGRKHDDIFKRITNRVYSLCGNNRLTDCNERQVGP